MSAVAAAPTWRQRLRRGVAIELAALAAVLVVAIGAALPPWAFMLTLAAALFLAAKAWTWRHAARHARATRHRALAYALSPGMDPVPFLGARDAPQPSARDRGNAIVLALLGWIVTWVITRQLPSEQPWLVAAVGVAGLVLLFHFGVLQAASLAWQSAGFRSEPIMRAPVLATSLGDFWGRRWNTAFADLSRQLVLRPLAPRVGVRLAHFACFVASGLVHEVVISWPARGGWGMPTLYFVVQGVGVAVERSSVGLALGLGTGLRGRIFALATVILPAPLLFHRPFAERVALPLLGAIGALP